MKLFPFCVFVFLFAFSVLASSNLESSSSSLSPSFSSYNTENFNEQNNNQRRRVYSSLLEIYRSHIDSEATEINWPTVNAINIPPGSEQKSPEEWDLNDLTAIEARLAEIRFEKKQSESILGQPSSSRRPTRPKRQVIRNYIRRTRRNAKDFEEFEPEALKPSRELKGLLQASDSSKKRRKLSLDSPYDGDFEYDDSASIADQYLNLNDFDPNLDEANGLHIIEDFSIDDVADSFWENEATIL